MNIGYEAKRFFTNHTGLGNYSRFILDALTSYYPDNQYFLYSPIAHPHREGKHIVARPNVSIVTPGSTYKFFKAKSLWRTWGISQHPSMTNLDVFHGLSHELPVGLPAHIQKVVTVHDLIFLRYPEFYHQIDIWIYKSKLSYACRAADKVIAISKQTAADLVEFLDVDPAKISVVYQGCHPNFQKKFTIDEIENIKRKHKLPSEYILNVGTVEPRKNVGLLVKALAEIPKESRLPVVVVGQHTPYYKSVVEVAQKLNVSDDVLFLNNVPFADFPAIYQGAKLFVYPSLFEGFGIPLVEAIQSGVPVITSAGSCFSEAAGPASKYVPPTDAIALKETILEVLCNDDLRKKMVADGSQYIQRFTSQQIATDLMHVYRSLDVNTNQ